MKDMTTLSSLNSIRPLSGLVLLIGPPGSGKTTFAEKLIAHHLLARESYVSNDEIAKKLFGVATNRGSKDGAIFAEQDKRVTSLLKRGKAAVVDATNVKPEARQRLIAIAQGYSAPVTAFCFKRDTATLLRQNKGREVEVPETMIVEYAALMEYVTPAALRREGIENIFAVDADVQRLTR